MNSPQEPRAGRVSLAAVVRAAVMTGLIAVGCAAVYAQSGGSSQEATPPQAGTQPQGATPPQGGTTTPVDPTAPGVRFTPNDPRPTPGWTLTPTFAFSLNSDDNITLAGQGTPTVADDVAAPTPSVDLSYFGRTTSFNGGYAGSATRYFTVNQLDTFDQRLYANFSQQVTRRVQLFGNESASWLPATDTILLTGVPFGRIGSQVESYDAGGTMALNRTTEVTSAYRYERVTFDRDPALGTQLLGGHTNGVYGNVRHEITSRLAIGGSYDIRRAIIAEGLQQFDMLNAEGTVDVRVTPQLSISAGGGLARIAGTLLNGGTRVGPAFYGNANYRFQRVLVYGSYMRSYVPSYGIGGTMQNQDLSAGATLPVAFRDRLIVGGNTAWRRNDPLDQTANRLTSRWLNLFGSYAFVPWLRVEGFFTRDTQDSHLGGVQRNRVGVQVVTFAPMRFK